MSILVHFKHNSVTQVAKHSSANVQKRMGAVGAFAHISFFGRTFLAELLRRLTTLYVSDFISLGFLLLSQTGELQRRLGADVAHFLFGRICF